MNKCILARILHIPLALYRSHGPTAEQCVYVLDKIIIAFSQATKLLCLHVEMEKNKTNKECLVEIKRLFKPKSMCISISIVRE